MKLHAVTLWATLVACSIPFGSQAAENDPPLISSAKATITKLDFDASMQRIPEKDRVEFLLDQKRLDSTVQSLYVNRALANEARKLALDKDPIVTRQLALQADALLTKVWVEKIRRDAKLPDFAARASEKYRVEDKQYSIAPQVHAMHILIDTKTRTREEALKKAQEVRAMAVAGKKDFGALAQEFSDDPSAKTNKGDLGFFGAERMLKSFSDVAFALTEPGQIAEPVETKFGIHIIKLVEKKAGSKKPFDKVKADIIKELEQEYLDNTVRELVNAVKLDTTIKTNTDAILALRPVILKPGPAAPQDKKP